MTNSTPSDVNSYQVGGNHYAAAIQHWDFVAAYRLDYFQGVATKYICRWRKKNGLEDLRKAAHYLIKRIALTAFLPMNVRAHLEPAPTPSLEDFCASNQLSFNETELITLITHGELPKALEYINAFISTVEQLERTRL